MHQLPVGGFQAFNGSLVGQANNGAPGQGTNFLWSGSDEVDIDHRPVRVNGGGLNGLDELRFDGQVMGMINTGPLPAGTGLDFFMLGRPAHITGLVVDGSDRPLSGRGVVLLRAKDAPTRAGLQIDPLI